MTEITVTALKCPCGHNPVKVVTGKAVITVLCGNRACKRIKPGKGYRDVDNGGEAVKQWEHNVLNNIPPDTADAR